MSQPAVQPPELAAVFTRGALILLIALLLGETTINFVDRQVLSVLAPTLRGEFHLSNSQYAAIINAFMATYAVALTLAGYALDRLGVGRGLTLSVSWWSVAGMLTALSRGPLSLGLFRSMLAMGEAGAWPAFAKATAAWVPSEARTLAIGVCNSGSSLGAMIAPPLVVGVTAIAGWRGAFIATGGLGFLWVLAFQLFRRTHPQMARAERAPVAAGDRVRWVELLRYRQTWGIVLGRFLLDPFWFFIAEWFALYLSSKGFRLEASVLGFWMPFLGADLGNFAGGGLSSYWISRGWPVGKARRAVLIIFGPSMVSLLLVLRTSSYFAALLIFAYAAFAYAACSTMFLSLPTDVFQSRAVGTVSGMAGTGAGIGTMVSTYLIGRVTDVTSFAPVIVGAAIVPCLATLVFVSLVRPSKRPDPRGLLVEF